MALGQNLTLKDGKLKLELNEWLRPLSESAEYSNEIIAPLEPAAIQAIKGVVPSMSAKNIDWCRGLDSNQHICKDTSTSSWRVYHSTTAARCRCGISISNFILMNNKPQP